MAQCNLLFPCQADQPRGEWHCLAPELLDNLKAQLEESAVDICESLQAMKNLRLVNRHWSSWATGATTMLRVTEHHVLFTELVEMLAEKFVSLSILYLHEMNTITDDGLHALLKLPSLTHLYLGDKGYTRADRVTDVGMGYLGRLTALRVLNLFRSWRITDV